MPRGLERGGAGRPSFSAGIGAERSEGGSDRGSRRMQQGRWRRSRAGAALLAILLLVSSCATPPQEDAGVGESARRPNFLVILCDDLGYGDLACYGHPRVRTPHLDRLAEQGMRLTSCYAAAPVCSSSRAGLLTGRTPSRVGVYDWIPAGHPVHLPARERTLATLLRSAGYRTAQVGKWHLNGVFNDPRQPQPGEHGFDHWFATQNNAAPSHEDPRNFVRNGAEVGPLRGYSCQLVADEAIAWLEARPADAPFFLFVCFHEPHEPVASPPDLVRGYEAEARSPGEAQYLANITNLDRAVGRIIERLDALGLGEDTVVLFTSDNGPETLDRYRGASRSHGSPGPLRGMKLWLYEGGIRVPGLLRWSGRVPGGQVVDVPFCGVDVLPTLCALAGVEPPADRILDGSDATPLLEGRAFDRDRPLYWHYYRALGDPKAALREGRWMILASRVGTPALGRNINERSMAAIKGERLERFELYDLSRDPAQQQDLAAVHPELLERLKRRLLERHAEVREEGVRWEFP